MADRNSAAIFGKVFPLLAKKTPHDEIAKQLWDAIGDYDFSEYQMCADGALVELGFARKCSCGGFVYGDDDRWHNEPECQGDGSVV